MNRSLFAVGILALAGSLSVEAQSIRVKADIPFEFHAGQTLLPPGQYTVTHSAGVLALRNDSRPASGTFLIVNCATRGSRDSAGKMVFNRYGEDYFLSTVWEPGSASGIVVPPSKVEREMAKAASAPVQSASVRIQAR